MNNFEEDPFTKFEPKLPQDVNSHNQSWTLSELVAVCLTSFRPPTLEDPRAAFIELAQRLNRQLWNEHQMQAPENRGSATFRRSWFVGTAFARIEYEIRLEHGRLRLPLAELEASLDPLNKAVQKMRVFRLRPAPLQGDLKFEELNLADDQSFTTAQIDANMRVRASDDDEMELGDFDTNVFDPAGSTFDKYRLHCLGVLQSIRGDEQQVPDGQPPADGPADGKWVWWKGKKFEVNSPQTWKLIEFFWKRNSAHTDDLVDGAGKIWEESVTNGAIHTATHRLNAELGKIGLPWKLTFNVSTRRVIKDEK